VSELELATLLARYLAEWEQLDPIRPGLTRFLAERLIEDGIVEGD
jgi:hypothetical protein